LKSRASSFIHKLSYAFLSSISLFLLAGGLTWYLLDQLENAVEHSIGDILPQAMIAMHLSENSAELLASAPQLLTAKNQSQTKAIATKLDSLQDNIIKNINRLEDYNYSNPHAEMEISIRNIVNKLVGNLIRLKQLADNDIQLKQQLSEIIIEIQQLNNELLDNLSPVVWGGNSLSRLSAQRTIRQNQQAIERLQNQQLPLLKHLTNLQGLFFKIKNQQGSPSATLIDEFEQTLRQLSELNFQHKMTLLKAIEQTLFAFRNSPGGISTEQSEQLEVQFQKAILSQQNQIDLELSNNKQLTSISIIALTEQTNRELDYALNIKAEGNLLFALLNTIPDIKQIEKTFQLQQRFKNSYDSFHLAVSSFTSSRLSKRNPILAASIEGIDQRLALLGQGEQSLFLLRQEQLQTHANIEQLLDSNSSSVARLKKQVNLLVQEVRNNARSLGSKLETSQRFHNKILLSVFIVVLLLSTLIAIVTIFIFVKHERELRQASAVFDNTAEGIAITDTHSNIIAVNQAFSEISGYSPQEVKGKNISILKSGRHRPAFYEELWQTMSKTGRWQGEIYNRRKNGDIYPEWLTINAIRDHNNEIYQYVGIFSDITMLKNSLAEMDHLANHDTLTGLPNRLLFNDRLKHALIRAQRDNQQMAVLFLDLDHFKSINDNLGHKAGDELLCQVAKRLTIPLREVDTVARLGGDEFTIIMENIANKQDVIITAKKILAAFTPPFHINTHHFSVTTSIGISIFPDHGNSADTLIENADMAMYLAKHTGKNNYQFYSSDLEVHKSPTSMMPN